MIFQGATSPYPTITISVCMIVKNEEETLARCLDCAKQFADEIIVADTGSTDRTKAIAAAYTDKLYDFAWTDDFSDARNFAFSKATMDYLMWLDADDILLAPDIAKLRSLKQNLSPDTDVVMMRYNTGFDDAGNVTFSFFRERLLKRTRGFKWHEPVHEYIAYSGKVVEADIAVTHKKIKEPAKKRNLEIYEKLLAKDGTLSPRGMYYYARELKDHARWEDAAAMLRRFLARDDGWVEDKINACLLLSDCEEQLKHSEQALTALLKSFQFDLPRAEALCALGYWFLRNNRLREAVYWFEQALSVKPPEKNWGFSQPDCRGYLPCIELAVCHDQLGDTVLAESYNERAAVFKPDSAAVAYNRTYFAEKNARNKSTEDGI
ncbi:MAG: glycosyltransferase family 2 protein [Oscillospiraceae bacterium]